MTSQAIPNAHSNAAGATSDQKLPQVKAEVLRDQILATPGLTGIDGNALLIVLAAALLAESEDGYNREAALGILERARKVSPENLADATQKLTAQMAEAMSAFWNGFIQETWEGPDQPPKYVDPTVVARRKELEEQEQEQNRKLAVQYVNNAQVAVAALVIDDKEFPQIQETKKPGFKFDMKQAIHNLLYKSTPAEGGPTPSAAPGWLTPPLLDKHAEDVTVFDNDIMDIVSNRKLSGEQAWKKLEDRGYDRQRIVRTIYNVRKIAQEQIVQCDQILSFIRTDYETHIEPVVKQAVLLGHAISVVNSFYATPAVAPSTEEIRTRPNPRTRGR